MFHILRGILFNPVLPDSFERDAIMSNLDPTITYDNFKDCEMVVEAVFEDINIKHKVIKEVEAVSCINLIPCWIILSDYAQFSYVQSTQDRAWMLYMTKCFPSFIHTVFIICV